MEDSVIENLIDMGYLNPDQSPIKCYYCKTSNFVKKYFGESGILHYQLHCIHCGLPLSKFVYSYWQAVYPNEIKFPALYRYIKLKALCQ